MNERIKELESQCWEPRKHPASQTAMGDKFNTEKFAELIVRECAEVSFKHWEQHKECSAHFSIREHFGVER